MLNLDGQGRILAPGETKERLLSRTAAAQQESTPFESEAHELTYNLYRFRLQNISVIEEKKSLLPWQGAVLWSYQRDGGEPFPVIQLGKKRLRKRSEMLAHELVHASRFSFKEPFFEEILAYQTSNTFFYRFFGPLFIFEKEPLLYLATSFISFFCFIVFENEIFFEIPSFLLGIFLLRLVVLQTLFYFAKKHVLKAGAKAPLAVLLRLSDKEIVKAAFLPPKNLLRKLTSGKSTDLRLKEVVPHYFQSETL
jgi:hypothetical protein